MHPLDFDKIVFITPQGLYCYNVMSSSLKNAGATYQRLETKIFWLMLGKTIEVYIDDMSVKSLNQTDHLQHLEEAFSLLWKYDMKLTLKRISV